MWWWWGGIDSVPLQWFCRHLAAQVSVINQSINSSMRLKQLIDKPISLNLSSSKIARDRLCAFIAMLIGFIFSIHLLIIINYVGFVVFGQDRVEILLYWCF